MELKSLSGVAHRGPTFLVICDFDHTLLDNNSDICVIEALGLADEQKKLWDRRVQWTDHISQLLEGFDENEIRVAVRKSVKVHPGVVEALNFVQAHVGDGKAEIAIASDANTLFVEEAFAAFFPGIELSQIHTNPYVNLVQQDPTSTKKSQVKWYEPNGHQCDFCNSTKKPNQCKSEVVRRILRTTNLVDPTIIYCGDGGNDCCPIRDVLRLRDHAFVRAGFPIQDLMEKQAGNCGIHYWRDGSDLHSLFVKVFNDKSCNPPQLMTFVDGIDLGHLSKPSTHAAPAEYTFRSKTMYERLPKILRRIVESLNEGGSTIPDANHLDRLTRLADGISRMASIQYTLAPYTMQLPKEVKAPCWGDLPWLHGEILIMLLAVGILQDDEELRRDLLSSVTGRIPRDYKRFACGASRSTDIYRFDKLTSIEQFLKTHIEPLTSDTTKAWQKRQLLPSILRQCLWGNAVDLCMFTLDTIPKEAQGVAVGMLDEGLTSDHPLALVSQLDDRIVTPMNQLTLLCNKIWSLVDQSDHPRSSVHLVMDNVGVEATSDLLLALFMVEQSRGVQVHLHVKPISFYVSDVAPWDIDVLLERLEGPSPSFVQSFRQALEDKRITIGSSDFWIQPSEWRDMPGSVSSHLFTQRTAKPASRDILPSVVEVEAHTSLIIVKGDLNYRRVFGDRHYEISERGHYPTAASVLSPFWPRDAPPIACIRTIKSELVVEVDPKRVPKPQADEDWRVSGRYGQIILYDPAAESA